nr:immunoglobulin heavy chain junction region [Macaca mulatta]MOX92436.1 immunoglobulin heavy chain junction region [Macaca mulatta]MOX92960.1 immunoglobulin heavy chain junction region [Macaca mulatta]MOX93344.1 immunoglobulin heavy chain junction region [Macaca mulatta]MOX94933.1 immunoglobulin heavy chain junction region [Macaca mulatta]
CVRQGIAAGWSLDSW